MEILFMKTVSLKNYKKVNDYNLKDKMFNIPRLTDSVGQESSMHNVQLKYPFRG